MSPWPQPRSRRDVLGPRWKFKTSEYSFGGYVGRNVAYEAAEKVDLLAPSSVHSQDKTCRPSEAKKQLTQRSSLFQTRLEGLGGLGRLGGLEGTNVVGQGFRILMVELNSELDPDINALAMFSKLPVDVAFIYFLGDFSEIA
jgi:hypothetical protein